jgi:hypothetical protein
MTFQTLPSGKIACNDAVPGAPIVVDITAIAGVLLLLPLCDGSAIAYVISPSYMKLTVQ